MSALTTNDDGIDSAGLPGTLDYEAMCDDNSLRPFCERRWPVAASPSDRPSGLLA